MSGVIGPAIITFFLVRVSGVALLEQTLQETKPGYRGLHPLDLVVPAAAAPPHRYAVVTTSASQPRAPALE